MRWTLDRWRLARREPRTHSYRYPRALASFATCDRIIRRDFYAFYAGFTVRTPSGHTDRLTSLLFGARNAASCDVLRLIKSAPL
jgi:hypothetical protein